MTKTIANFLQENNVAHNIAPDSPILFLPIALFNEEERDDLMVILWLYDQKLINDEKARQPHNTMDEVSAKKITDCFDLIKRNLKSKKPFVVSDSIKTVDSTLMSQYIATKSACKTFNGIAHRFVNFTYRFLTNSSQIADAPVFSEYAQILNASNIRKESIQAMAGSLAKSTLFEDEPDPKYIVYEYIIKLNKMTPNELYNKEVLNYFRDVLIELSRKYPPTLDALLLRFDIALPSDLNADLIDLLDIQLNKLSQDEQSELIYYTLLFLSKAAQEDPKYNFSYAGNELPDKLNKIALDYAKLFKDYAAKPAWWGKVLNKNLFSGLQRRLGNSFPGIHPKLLALICFKNCPMLKKLFDSRRENSNSQTTAILPLKNRFLLGRTYRMRGQQHPISIGNDDLIIFEQLKKLAEQFKKTKTRDASIKLFSSVPTEIAAFKAGFLKLKMKIKNTELRASLSLTSMDDFVPCMIINHESLLDFFTNNVRNIDSPEPSYEHLKDFFEIHTTLTAVDPLIEQAHFSEILEGVDNEEGLNEATNIIKNRINLFNKKLKAFNSMPLKDEVMLRIRWVEVQKYVQVNLLMMAQEKLTDLAELERVRGASNCIELRM